MIPQVEALQELLNKPLQWVCEDAKTGTEVSYIPRVGRVWFLDQFGPVATVSQVKDAKWRVICKYHLRTDLCVFYRVTVVQLPDETFVNMIPGTHAHETTLCTLREAHDGCQPWLCAYVADQVHAMWLKII